jgi:hypothetical protein
VPRVLLLTSQPATPQATVKTQHSKQAASTPQSYATPRHAHSHATACSTARARCVPRAGDHALLLLVLLPLLPPRLVRAPSTCLAADQHGAWHGRGLARCPIRPPPDCIHCVLRGHRIAGHAAVTRPGWIQATRCNHVPTRALHHPPPVRHSWRQPGGGAAAIQWR